MPRGRDRRMSVPPPSPDMIAAQAVRRALRVEKENNRLHTALARPSTRLAVIEMENQALWAPEQDLAEGGAA